LRKNQVGRKGVGGIYTVYEIRGLNLDRFLNTVKNRGVEMYDVKKQGNKKLIVSVSYFKSQKFFAIAKELCYNIKKVRDKGKGYPLLQLYRSFGMVIGALIFFITSFLFSDLIFAFSFEGSGSLYKRETEAYLYSKGVKPFTRFSSFELEELEDGILAVNPHLSFASCIKKGNRLIINTALSSEKVKTLPTDVYALYSDVDGIVESVKVYRGTAKVSAGDEVKSGQLLVEGSVLIKEQTVKINVLATVTVRVKEVVIYRSKNAEDELNATIFAEEQLSDKEILKTTVVKTQENGEYVYAVAAEYRRIIYT